MKIRMCMADYTPPAGDERDNRVAELVSQVLAEVTPPVTNEPRGLYKLKWKGIVRNLTYAAQVFTDEGCFMDSCHPLSLLNILGKSWERDVLPLICDDVIPEENLEKLRNWVKATPVPDTATLVKQLRNRMFLGPDSAAWLRACFEAYRQMLLLFLEEALRSGYSIVVRLEP